MKFVCTEYVGWDALVSELGAPDAVFYLGDSSSEYTTLAIAYFETSPTNVVVFRNVGGVPISTLTTDYSGAVAISGLYSVEV